VLWFTVLSLPAFSEEAFHLDLATGLVFAMAWIFIYFGHCLGVLFANPRFAKPQMAPKSPAGKFWLYALYVLLLLSVLGNYTFYRSVFTTLNGIESLILLRTTDAKEMAIESSNMLYNVFGRIYVVYIPIALYVYKIRQLSLYALVLISVYALLPAAVMFTRAPILFLFLIFFQ